MESSLKVKINGALTVRPPLAFLVRGVGNVIKAEAALFEKELGQ